MALVNGTDTDRGSMEEYVDELTKFQEVQLSMISTLRESLVEYYATRPEDDDEDDDEDGEEKSAKDMKILERSVSTASLPPE